MKSISTLFRQLFLIVALISAFSLSAWGEEETISFASTAQRVSQNTSSQVWKNGDVTFTNNKASSTTNVANYSNPVRLYANSEVVIEAPGNIEKIVVTANNDTYATDLRKSAGAEASVSGSTVTITPTASATSYIIAKLTAQVRLNSITVTYTTAPAQAHTITFSAGTGTYTGSSLTGISIELPSATPCNSDWTFAGWSENEISETTTEPTIFKAGDNYNPKNDITLYAVYVSESTETTDAGTIWVSKSISYITSSDVVVITMKNSGGVYAATNDKGTGSAPEAIKVTVDSNNQLSGNIADNIKWNISKSSENLTIYPNGTTTKWLYCTNSNNGVRVGTNANKTFTIDGSSGYLKHTGTSRYLGVYNSQDWRCYTNTTGNTANQTLAFYVQTTGSATVTTYTYNSNPNCSGSQPDEPELEPLATPIGLVAEEITDNSFTAKWNAVVNATEYEVTLGGDTYTTTNTFYQFPNLNPETNYTFTVRAIGDNETYSNSEIATSETITTLAIEVNNIAEFIEEENTTNDVIISGEVIVTAISEKQDVIWIEDNSGAIMVYGVSNKSNYKVGDAFSGVKGLYENYNGLPEIKNPIFPNEKGVGEPSDPEKVTIFSVKNDILLNKLVKIENVIYTNKVTNNNDITTRTFIDADDETINSYDSHFSAQDININDKVNLTAIVGKYNTQYQLYIISAERVKEPTISVSVSELDFGDVVENKELSKSTTITTVDLGESAGVSISGINASCFAVNTNKIEDNSETEITITFTAPDVDVETECTATLTITGGSQTKEIALTATVKPLLALTANINGIPIPQEVGTFAEGDDITTALNEIDVTAPEGWSFAGWVANAIDGSQTTTPEYLTTMPAEATTAYAVFKLGKEVQTTEILNGSSATYAKNSGYCDFTATSASGTWTGTACYNTKDYLQINKNPENYHIGSPIFTGNVTSLKITTTNNSAADRTFYIRSSNSTAEPNSGDLGQHTTTTANEEFTINLTKEAKQFYIYSSKAVYISKIEITYIEASDILYRTSVSSLVVENNTPKTISENVNSLTLHVDKTPNTQLEVTETITADKVTVIQTIDASRWFFFSLPFDCNIADIVATYVNGGAELKYAPDASTGDYVITEYNGGWVELTGTSHTLKANQGYIIGHFRSGDVTVKFPSNGAQNISAPANATLAKTSDNGFNLIGLPYFQKVTNAGLNVAHVSIPNVSNPNEYGTYTQEVYAEIIASIAPFTSFFVQTEAENIEFTLGAQQNAAPRLDGRSNQASLHKAVVTLTDANGGVDKTTIINNPNNTTDYEIGHDLTKLIGYASIPQIYSHQGEEMLAFNSLAIDNSTVIPLGVYAHADGEYTFALSEKSIGDLQGWELYDNETGKTTRLANEDLTIYLEQGTHEGRFEIRLQQRISTDCDNSMGDMMTWTANGTLNINNMPTDAVVYIYDAVGRIIYVATPNATTFNYSFAARGVYNIVVRSADNTVSFKTIY